MIKFPERIKQVLNFKGIGNSKIHPTDIDAILEFNEKHLIIFEVKKEGMKVPIGQKLLFERLADCWEKTNGPAWVVYCFHTTETKDIIDMENCYVKYVYRDAVIHKHEASVRDFLMTLADKYEITKLKESL